MENYDSYLSSYLNMFQQKYNLIEMYVNWEESKIKHSKN